MRIITWLGGLLLMLVAVLLVRTVIFSNASAPVPKGELITVDAGKLANVMSQAIQFPTISTGDENSQDYQAFVEYVAWIQRQYPQVHEALALTKVADHTLLYEWRGTDSSLKPILLTAHYDVVPIAPGSEQDWNHPPFSGANADGYIWGRGALDDKSAMIVMLEAATILLKEGFTPERTVYFSFGHDEEIGGPAGAAGVTELLRNQGVELAWTLDEGSFVTDGIVPGVDRLVAMVNVAEKGSVTFDLIAHGPSGHSSMPAAELPIDILAKALIALRSNPIPGGLDGVGGEMIDGIAREGSFPLRLLAANKWLFGGLLESQLGGSPSGNAMLRTTTAPTLLNAGIKTNVITPTAVATVNFRLHPRDTADSVKHHIETVVADPRIEVVMHGDGYATPASNVSSRESDAFKLITRVTGEVFDNPIVVPGLTVGGTDSKHYSQIAENSYRYQFMTVNADDLTGFHGTNERVSIDNLVLATISYYKLLKQGSTTLSE